MTAKSKETPASPGEKGLVFFDVETQRLSDEVGGWEHIDRMGLACAVTYSEAAGEYHRYLEAGAADLVAELRGASLVVGFNVKRFDYAVLQPYTEVRLSALPTVDLLEHIYRRLGFRVGLEALAEATLGERKTADGIQAVDWFRRGEVDKVLDYCQQDVEVTRRLYEFGRAHQHVKFRDKHYKVRTAPVAW